MASEEEKKPAYINYGEDSEMDDFWSWTSGMFKDYWSKLLLKHHRLGGVHWSIKDSTLLKKMIEEFQQDELKAMLEHWIQKTSVEDGVAKFNYFYTARYKLKEKVQEKDYEWD